MTARKSSQALADDPAAPKANRAAVQALAEATRVRLGAATDTPAETLGVLAADPSVTVRAAVAMNPAAPVGAHQLLATDADERVRTLLARKLAALLPTLKRDDRAALQAHTLAMLTQLVEDEAVRVRRAIAEVVKEMPSAPRDLILRLARDSALPVSEPVIRLSPLLTAEDLLALLADRPASGVARAVASRHQLPFSVSDALAASADNEAIGVLLDNGSAAIREATLDALIERAAGHDDWQDKLVHRPVLSARATRALSDIVTKQLLGVLASRGDLDPDVTRDLRQRLANRASPPPEQPPPATVHQGPKLEVALTMAHELAADDRLDEAAVLAAAQRGEARLCTAMLAVAADVPVTVVERALTLRSAKGLVSLVWKAGFSMRVAGPLQVLLCRIGPDAVLRALEKGSFPLAVDEMRWQLEFLERVGR